MIRAINILKQITFFKTRSFHAYKLHRLEFFEELNYLNFSRLRIWSYFMAAFISLQLYFDFFLGGFWQSGQITLFMKLDIMSAIVTLGVILSTHIKPPAATTQIKPWHIWLVHLYIIYQLFWTAAISVVESSTNNSLTTYLMGAIFAAMVFIIRGSAFLVYMLASFLALFYGLYYLGMPIKEIMVNYSAYFALVGFGWVTSRALFNTRLRSFTATKELELAHSSLDRKVKERTVELRDTNEKLRIEITERKRYELILENEKKKAEQADHLKTIFLANMSHEIRTPLNGLLGFSELLQSASLSEVKRKRYLDIINSNGQQLLKIIDDIMDLSMIESNQLKINKVSFCMSHLFPDALVFFDNYRKVNNKSHIELIDQVPKKLNNDRILSDPTRIQQVFYNLLINSIKFTETGFVRVGCSVDNNFVLVYVEDSGIGVERSLRNTIFQRFRQGEESMTRSYGGTGLGLSISKGIIDLLDGHIWLDTSYMGGSRFCFSLPNDENTLVRKEISLEGTVRNKILVVYQQKNSGVFLSDTLVDNNVEVELLSFLEFESSDSLFAPHLLIFDFTDDLEDIEHSFGKLKEKYEDIPYIFILPEGILNFAANDPQCILQLKRPVNVQYLILFCADFFLKFGFL